jgi:hypothetical protein
MVVKRVTLVMVLLALAALLAACKGPSDPGEVTIVSINLNPAAVTAGSIVTLTASISAPGQSVSSLNKHWAVTSGSLSLEQPDFNLLLRATAKATDAAFVDTTNSTIYWVAPSSGQATITLTVDTATKTRSLSVGASPITMSVTGEGSSRTVTVTANNVTDLYQAAFRVNYSSAWTAASASAGDFLGSASQVLWLGLTNQSGFVPCALTRKGNVAGVDGSGTLATIVFNAKAGSSTDHAVANAPFELGLVMLRDSHDQPISLTP